MSINKYNNIIKRKFHKNTPLNFVKFFNTQCFSLPTLILQLFILPILIYKFHFNIQNFKLCLF